METQLERLVVPRTERTAYKNEAKKLLENSFPRISCAAINAVLADVDFRCPDAFRILTEIDHSRDMEDDNVAAIFPQMPLRIKVFLKHNRPKKRFRIHEPLLLEDIEAIPDLYEIKEEDPAPLPNEIAPSQDEIRLLEDVLLECGCCYAECNPKEMKQCNANLDHRICKDCIYRYVSEQLDGNNSINFQCIVHEECRHAYHQANVLDEVLSPGLKLRTNQAIFRSEVKQALGDGMW